MSVSLKSDKILEYFKFKSKINTHAFVDLIKDVPTVDFRQPHEGQWPILNAYEERVAPSPESISMGLDFDYRYRVLVAACGRRFGKSEIASVIGAQELLIPNAKVLIVSYTLDNCEVIFGKIHKIITGLGIKMKTERLKDMELELVNGSTLRVASNDNVQSKLGTAISLLIMDEAKLFDRALYEQVLMPMLFDYSPYSRTLLISSPQTGWFETYYQRGQSKDPKWSKYWSVNLPTHTNPTIPREELIAMEEQMPPDLYQQEVLGMFTSAEGLVAREFDEKTHTFDVNDYDYFHYWLKDEVVFHSIDSGYMHHFGSVWFVHVEHLDTIFVVDSYCKNKVLTPTHALYIKDTEQRWEMEPMIRYADPAAAQQIADFTQYDLYFNLAVKETKETVNCFNTLFFQKSAVTGRPKLLVNKDCTELIRQLNQCMWKKDKTDEQAREKSSGGVKPFMPDKEGKTDWDLLDSFRYGLYSYVKNNRVSLNVVTMEDLGNPDEDEDAMMVAMQNAGYFRVG